MGQDHDQHHEHASAYAGAPSPADAPTPEVVNVGRGVIPPQPDPSASERGFGRLGNRHHHETAEREAERASSMQQLQNLDPQRFPNRLAFLNYAIGLLEFVEYMNMDHKHQALFARRFTAEQIERDDHAVAEVEPADDAQGAERQQAIRTRNAAHHANVARQHEQQTMIDQRADLDAATAGLQQHQAAQSHDPHHLTTAERRQNRDHAHAASAETAAWRAIDHTVRTALLHDAQFSDVGAAEIALEHVMPRVGIDPQGWAARVFFAYAGAPYASAHGTAASPSRLLGMLVMAFPGGLDTHVEPARAASAAAKLSSTNGGQLLAQLQQGQTIQLHVGSHAVSYRLTEAIPEAARTVIAQLTHGNADATQLGTEISALPEPWHRLLHDWRANSATDWLGMPEVEANHVVCDQLSFEAQRARGVGMPNGLSQGARWFRGHQGADITPEGSLRLVNAGSTLEPGTALFHVVYQSNPHPDPTHRLAPGLLTDAEMAELGLVVEDGVVAKPDNPPETRYPAFRHEATVVIPAARGSVVTLETTDSRHGGGDGGVSAEGTGMAMRPIASPSADEQREHPGHDGLSPSLIGFWLAGYLPEHQTAP